MKTPPLSQELPEVFRERTVETRVFTETLTGFLKDYFAGLLEIEVEGEPEGFLYASFAGVAYFLREALRSLAGKRILRLTFRNAPEKFFLILSFRPEKAFSSLGFSLARAAAASGFEAKLSLEGETTVITLTFPKKSPHGVAVYAPVPDDTYSEIFRAFFGECATPCRFSPGK